MKHISIISYLSLCSVVISLLVMAGDVPNNNKVESFSAESLSEQQKTLNATLLRRAATYRDQCAVDSRAELCVTCGCVAQTLYLDYHGIVIFYCLAHYPKDK